MKILLSSLLSAADICCRRNECRSDRGGTKTNLLPRAARNNQRQVLLTTPVLALLGLLWWTPIEAAVYYVDFVGGSDSNAGTSPTTPWKRVKGMAGVTGVAAAAGIVNGDTIIFKGGVTWTSFYPWHIIGGTSSMVTYTTDHAWFTGATWSQPVFDQQSTGTNYATNPMISNIVGASYPLKFLTINDLKFYRCGAKLVVHDAACMYFMNLSDVTLTNNTFEAYAGRFVIFFNFNSGGTRSNFTITGNNVSNAGSFIWMASTASGAVEQNFVYTNNTIHDFASQLGATGSGEGNHGDGFLHFYTIPNNDSTQFLDRLTFCNNRTYGDFRRGIGDGNGQNMTGFFFVEGAIKNTLICNNEFTMNPMSHSTGPAPIWGDGHIFLRSYGNPSVGLVWIFNNTFGFDPSQQEGGALVTTDSGWSGGLQIKNNIFSGGTACTWTEGGAKPTGTTDYNEYRCPMGFQAGWMTDGGHSIFGNSTSNPDNDPKWTTPFTNFRLTSTSPGRGTGTNLSTASGLSAFQQSVLNRDRDGVARPTSGPWDMGAYQSSAAVSTAPPPSPTNLSVQ